MAKIRDKWLEGRRAAVSEGAGGVAGRRMSLRPGGQSQTISAGTYAAEHQCAFWDAG